MKTIFLITVILTGFNAFSATSAQKVYQFQFKSLKAPIAQAAATKDEAYKLAAKECFKKLTAGKYPGEEKGLEIIDICANPKM